MYKNCEFQWHTLEQAPYISLTA